MISYTLISGPGITELSDSSNDSFEIDRSKLQEALNKSLLNEGFTGLAVYSRIPWLLSLRAPKVCTESGRDFREEELTYGGAWLRWEAHTSKELSESEIKTLKNFITGQCSDGWGEGFEQHECYTLPSKDFLEEDVRVYFKPWWNGNCLEPWTVKLIDKNVGVKHESFRK